MNRTPPSDVVRALRQEINFVCPVAGCRNPFLTWHHFDPPWHERHHHDPAGMIALCRPHHDHADNGAFTTDQLRALKTANENSIVQAHFNWLRNKLLVNVGGNFHYDVTDAVSIDGNRWIWFERDQQNNLLLNFSMPSTDGRLRSFIRRNTWFELGEAEDLVCPPHGRFIRVKYANGDRFKVEFKTYKNGERLKKKYPAAPHSVTGVETQEEAILRNQRRIPNPQECPIKYPVTVVEITISLKSGGIKITPTSFAGFNVRNCLFVNSPLNIKTSGRTPNHALNSDP